MPAPTTITSNPAFLSCCLKLHARPGRSDPLHPSLPSGARHGEYFPYVDCSEETACRQSGGICSPCQLAHTRQPPLENCKSAYYVHRAFGKLLSVDVSGTAITDDGIQLILGASKVLFCLFGMLLVVMVVVVTALVLLAVLLIQFVAVLRSAGLTCSRNRLCWRRWWVLSA